MTQLLVPQVELRRILRPQDLEFTGCDSLDCGLGGEYQVFVCGKAIGTFCEDCANDIKEFDGKSCSDCGETEVRVLTRRFKGVYGCWDCDNKAFQEMN